MFIDSHAHLTSSLALFEQVDAVLARAQKAQIQTIVNICTDLDSLQKGLELAQRYPWIHLAAATTPHDVEKEGEAVFAQMAAAAYAGQLKAVGETGLDYHYEHSPRLIQQTFLRRYLKLALECHLPVVIHCREAFADLFKILEQEYSQGKHLAPGVLHCFTGTMAEAEAVIQRGWMLSLSGIVTFKKSVELHEVAKRVPLKQLLIETDAPYLAPQSQRGKTNEPAFVVETAAFIARLKGIELQELAEATTQNAQKLFNF